MKLAIIIPTIGRHTLHQVLDSLLIQIKHNNLQEKVKIYLGIDDIQDSHLDLQKKYPHKCLIFLYTNSQRSGAANARNICLQQAINASDLIAFLGDDTIPDKNWLTKLLNWHKLNPQSNKALLGRVLWVDALINDPLHKWLDGHIQFDFKRLDNGYTPDWRHFTTSNLSIKSSLLQSPLNLFNTNFKGWGFEDSELGYRLFKQKSLHISYDPTVKVFHDHPQSFSQVLQNISNARKNAFLFEQIHPEQKILPTKLKKLILFCLASVLFPFPKFISSKTYWWSRSKLAWLGINF